MVSKQRYKTTEIGKVPADWDVVTLENLIEERKEKTTKINQYDILTSARTGLYLQSEYFNRVVASENNIGYRVIRKNDFTYRSMSDDGLFVFNRLENMDVGMVSPAYSVFRFKNQNVSDFYKYYLNSSVFLSNVLKDIQGGTRLALRFSALKKMKVAFPPLLEQRKIAAILTSVDDAIEKTEAIIKQTENVKKGLMQRLLTKGIGHTKFKKTKIGEIPEEWGVKTFEQLINDGVIQSIQDGNHGELHPKSSDYVDSGIPFIMANDIKDGILDLSNCKFIRKEQADKLRIGFSKSGDVLLTHKGTIGSVAIVPPINDYIMLTPQVTYYRIGDSRRLSNVFLYYFFQSPNFQSTLEKLSAQSTRAYIGITNQKKLVMPLPSIEEQTKIVNILSSVDNKLIIERKQYQYLQLIKQSLMHLLLTGKVRVKVDENDEVVV